MYVRPEGYVILLCILIPVDRLEERHEAILKEKKELHDKNIEVHVHVCIYMYMYKRVSVYCAWCTCKIVYDGYVRLSYS